MATPTQPELPPKLNNGIPSLIDWLNRLHEVVRRNRIVPVKGWREAHQGGWIPPDAPNNAYECTPWKPYGADGSNVKFRPGTIGGILPSDMLSDQAYTASGTEYIYLVCSVTGNAVSSATITIASSAPTLGIAPVSGSFPASFNWLLGIIQDGVFAMLHNENLAADPVERYQTAKASPTALAEPFDRWYSFDVYELTA